MPDTAPRPEARDVWPRALLAFGGGLVLFLAVALTVLWLLFDTRPLWQPPGEAAVDNRASPALQRDPAAELAAFQQRAESELNTLAWVDRDQGIARIPIGEAMSIVARRGLPGPTDAVAAESVECKLLRAAVPRAPQLSECGTEPRNRGGAP